MLLPLAWPYRLAEMLVRRGGTARRKMQVVLGTTPERAGEQERLLEAVVGLGE